MDSYNRNTKSKTFKHLSFKERCIIELRYKDGISVSNIARELGRSRTTIYSELKRGTTNQIVQKKNKIMYIADLGQQTYENNRAHSKNSFKFLKSLSFIEFVLEKFRSTNWSLDACVGYARRHSLFTSTLCTKTLYNYVSLHLIAIDALELPLKLRRNTKSKRVRKAKQILGRCIEHRPLYIEDREEFGHWEIDCIQGQKSGSGSVVLSLLERMTRFYITIKIKNKTNASVNDTIKELFSYCGDMKSEVFKSITCDNGLEFSKMSEFDGDTKIYFCHPYSSWERGSNERDNGLFRRFLPKGVSIDSFSEDEILHISDWCNTLPRKILDYATPEELFEQEMDTIYSTKSVQVDIAI